MEVGGTVRMLDEVCRGAGVPPAVIRIKLATELHTQLMYFEALENPATSHVINFRSETEDYPCLSSSPGIKLCI